MDCMLSNIAYLIITTSAIPNMVHVLLSDCLDETTRWPNAGAKYVSSERYYL